MQENRMALVPVTAQLKACTHLQNVVDLLVLLFLQSVPMRFLGCAMCIPPLKMSGLQQTQVPCCHASANKSNACLALCSLCQAGA